MTKRLTDGIRRACGIVEGMRDNEFAEITVRKAAVAEACDRLDEACEAADWVRDHGELDEVKAEWNRRSNLDRQLEKAQAKVERQQRHIEFVQGKCHERLKRIAALNKTVAEMRPRLMPEGMEWLVDAWPRFDDDAPLKLGDMALIDGDVDMVEAVQIWIHGKPVIYGDNGSQQLEKCERVKRPAVLAADGEPLEVGQTVWSVNDGTEYKIGEIRDTTDEDDDPCKIIRCSNDELHIYCAYIPPEKLTHQRPVLDADGVPIELGDDLYSVEGGLKLHVSNIDRVNCRIATSAMFTLDKWADPSIFTHTKPEPPDSLERIADEIDRLREEVALHLGDYLYDEDGNDSIQFSMELVAKRCRALAERERGE